MDDSSTRKFGFRDLLSRFVSGRKPVTADEIQELIKVSEEEGLVNEEESDMIRSIFSLRSTVVREIMVPRTDMACVSVESDIHDLLRTIIDCGHSRIPVYENTIDNVVGLLYAKDLLKHWGDNAGQIQVRSIMRPPFFIPETKNLEQLLQEFRYKHVHLAIVIDEYGGTSGLITIEDLLEQIVGDIVDEYDQEEPLIIRHGDGSATADARLSIEEFEQLFDLQVVRDKFDSLGGLIFHLTGTIPAIGDTIAYENLTFTILDADERRILSILIVPHVSEQIEQHA